MLASLLPPMTNACFFVVFSELVADAITVTLACGARFRSLRWFFEPRTALYTANLCKHSVLSEEQIFDTLIGDPQLQRCLLHVRGQESCYI